ncbi:MAG: tetratricopeptide repeat protein [Planctomycetes bacterium]|nr:tetratricopeptide repeat protein [Planctomycetota bacterium]
MPAGVVVAEEKIRALLAGGRFVSAWRCLEPSFAAGLRAGEGAFLRLAHEVCWRIGSDRRRYWVARAAWARHRDRLWSWNQRLFDLIRRGRMFAAWELLQQEDRPAPTDADEALQFELVSARTFADLRDFSSAEAALGRALALAPDAAATWRERAWTALERDDLDGAIATVAAARQRWPDEPMLREQQCWLLLQRADPTAALAALAEADAALESPSLKWLRGQALFEAGDLGSARDLLREVVAVDLLERPARVAATMLLARIERMRGDDGAALNALTAAGPTMRKWAERLRAFIDGGAATGSGRVQLTVPFIRQDHVTCSPATMASLLAHAGVAVDQREIAAQITYDGTPSHAEMTWAQGRGLRIWFFQFDAAVAYQLIDRGLPFAISTRFEQSGHRQALIGYDKALGTFLLRDPGRRDLQEVDARWLEKLVRTRGGDCALIVPAEREAEVPVALLPLHAETQLLQQLRQAYDQRDLATVERLATRFDDLPDSIVRWEAQSRIAMERGDRRRRLSLWQQAYEANRDDPYWQYHHAVELRSQDRWATFVEVLQRHIDNGSPFLAMLLADHQRLAAPTRAQAEWLARRAIRALPRRSSAVRLLADILWDDPPRRRHAVAIYRLASLLEPFDEALAQSCFQAWWHLGEAEQGLQFLRERVATLGHKRSLPGATLARALEQLHRRTEAVTTLRQALAGHEDPDVREQLFDLLLADGEREAAMALLADPALWRPMALHQARYRLARGAGDHAAAAAALAAAVAIDGTSASLQVMRLRAVLAEQGRAAALAEVERVIAAHGEDPALLVAMHEFYEDLEERAASEALLRRLVAEHPAEGWLRGRLGRFLVIAGRAAEAVPIVEQLLRETPDSVAVWLDAIDVAEQLGDRALARQRGAEAAVRWAAEPALLRRRRGVAGSAEEAIAAVREAMAWLLESTRPPAADTLDNLAQVIAEDLTPAEAATFLERLQGKFPGQPAIAAARCRLLQQEDPAAACRIGEQLVAEFAWMHDHWLLHARCLRAAGRRDDERRLLERLLERDPTVGQAYVELGESLEEEGRTQEAMAIFERGIARAPTVAVLHGMRANLLWSFGARAEAIAAADHAATLDPTYGWARRVQVLWRSECGDHQAALAAAQACVRDNPRWAHAHDLLATALDPLGRHDERIAALRSALACAPRLGAARSRLLDALIELNRFAEAEEVIDEGLRLLGDVPELLLRRIEFVHARGELGVAREQLRKLLAAHADFARGWSRLLAWLDEERLDEEVLAIWREPPAALADNPTVHGYAAEVLLRRDDRPRAEKALRRALEIAPDYDWGRDQLANLLLNDQRPREVLALFPGATDPEQVPFHRAVVLARAAAATGDHGHAQRCFDRLLREPEADAGGLHAADRALLANAGRRHRRHLRSRLAASAQAREEVEHENCLQVLAMRGEGRAFFRGLTAFAAWLPEERREAAVARLLYVAKKGLDAAGVAAWARTNLRPPIRDTEAWGKIAYALSGRRGSRLLVDLTAGEYQRAGVRGWMLANLALAHVEVKEWDRAAAVAEYALREVPRDHSVWWHRRCLLEIAYERSDWPTCAELGEMASEEFPTVKVKVFEFTTLAQMAQVRGWWRRRRVLTQALPELLRLWRLADADDRGSSEPTELEWRRFFRLLPSLRTLSFAMGSFGRRVLGWFG